MGPTIADGPMSEEDTMIITTIKRGSVDRPHLGLITIHPKNPKEPIPMNFYLLSLEALDSSVDSMEHIVAFHA